MHLTREERSLVNGPIIQEAIEDQGTLQIQGVRTVDGGSMVTSASKPGSAPLSLSTTSSQLFHISRTSVTATSMSLMLPPVPSPPVEATVSETVANTDHQ